MYQIYSGIKNTHTYMLEYLKKTEEAGIRINAKNSASKLFGKNNGI